MVIDADGNVEQEFKAILDKKKSRRKIYYLVQFENDAPEDAIWMAKSELSNCRDRIQEFEESARTLDSKKGVSVI